MTTNDQNAEPRLPPRAKPYAIVGAGRLVSTIWKTGSELDGWRFRFNLFRMSAGGGVGQRFRPDDVLSLVKLAKVLATELAIDGCLAAEQREELADLSAALDSIFWTRD